MQFLDFLFPKRCIGCGKIGKYFCNGCRSSIRIIQPNEPICPVCEKPAIGGVTHPRCQSRYGLDGLISFFHYDGPVRKAIKALKYRFVSDLVHEFVALIPSSFIDVPMKQCNNSSFLIPIPLHPSRFRYRGFNQAEQMGKFLAVRLHLQMKTDILQRTKETPPQVSMKKRDARLKNMEGVFTLQKSFDKVLIDQRFVKASNLNVLLFDDVFTTGATMRSAANVLKRNGVQHVWAVTMAR